MSKARPKGAAEPMPDFVPPCLATLAKEPPGGSDWAHEIKFDGYRVQVSIEGGRVRLLTRRGLDWTPRFGTLSGAFAALKLRSALIDGEAVVEDERGTTSFTALVDALKTSRSTAIDFMAFDLLYLDGHNLASRPLVERKAMLSGLLSGRTKRAQLRYSEHVVGQGAEMLAGACKLGLEGIISKRLDKPYRSGRQGDWLKAKCLQSDEFVIAGYLDSTAMQEAIGALAVGFFEARRLCYAGRVGTGFDHDVAHELWKHLQPLRIAASPFAEPLQTAERHNVKWVAPKLVAQVTYRTLTAKNLLRHASFQGLREDLPAGKVQRPQLTGH